MLPGFMGRRLLYASGSLFHWQRSFMQPLGHARKSLVVLADRLGRSILSLESKAKR